MGAQELCLLGFPGSVFNQAAIPSLVKTGPVMLNITRQLSHLLTSVTVLFLDSSSLWILLLYVHIVTLLAGAIPLPQTITAASASAGISKDPSPSWPSTHPPAKRCPALEVTWPEVEVPLSKEQL